MWRRFVVMFFFDFNPWPSSVVWFRYVNKAFSMVKGFDIAEREPHCVAFVSPIIPIHPRHNA
jgi:hypothetical protein